jgi:hypothetical protein
MVFQSLPSTVYAAEAQETAAVEETVDTQETDDTAEEVVQPDDGAEEAAEAGDEEVVVSGSEDEKSENGATQETQNEVTNEAGSSQDEAVVVADEETAAATLDKAVIVFDENTFAANTDLKAAMKEYHYDDSTVVAVYAADSSIAKNVLEAAKKAVKVEVGAEADTSTAAKDHITYKWSKLTKNEEGVLVPSGDMTESAPSEVGEYRLTMSLPAVEGLCDKAETDVYVDLSIIKAEVEIEPLGGKRLEFAPTTTVAEAKQKVIENYTLTSISKDVAVSAVTAEIRELNGTAALEDTVKFQKNKDYVLKLNVTLADSFAKNYEIKEDTFNINLEDAIAVKGEVTYEDAYKDKVVGKKFDNQPFDITTGVYTVKYSYKKDNETVYLTDEELAGENFEQTAVWRDANGVELDSAPVDAGRYTYRITLTDKTGTYATAVVSITVEITAVDIAVVPKVNGVTYASTDASVEFPSGTSVGSILNNVEYDVYTIGDDGKLNTTPESNVDEYYWGADYTGDTTDKTQYYQPVFGIRKGVVTKDKDGKETTEWQQSLLSEETQITAADKNADFSYVYRIEFTGKKAVFNKNSGNYDYDALVDINASQGNYSADSSADAKKAYAIPLKVGEAVTIDVSALLTAETKAGESYDNAIISYYTGKSIYNSKDEYKKATAKQGEETLASGAASGLTYTWERASYYTTDKDGKRVPVWGSGSSYNNVETYSAPADAGEYRLTVTYSKDGVTSSKAGYVYYTILPQSVKAELTGAPEVYADYVYDTDHFISTVQNSKSDETDTYVTVAIKTLDGTDITDSLYKLANGYPTCNKYYEGLTYNHFYVEKKIVDGENAGEWAVIDEDTDTYFEKDKSYRLSYEFTGYENYNFGTALDKHGFEVDKDSSDAYVKAYDNGAVDIKIKETEGVGIYFDYDESLLDKVKVYDGQPFDIDKFKASVKIKESKTHNEVTGDGAPEITYAFMDYNEDEDHHESVDSDHPEDYAYDVADVIHAGTYSLRIEVKTNSKYEGYVRYIYGFEIEQAKLTLTPSLQEVIKAGQYIYLGQAYEADAIIAAEPTVAGFVGEGEDSDANKLTLDYNKTAYIYENNSTSGYRGYLRSDKQYYVEYTSLNLKGTEKRKIDGTSYTTGYLDKNGYFVSADRDYEIVSERASFTPVRAAATVDTYRNYNDETGEVVKTSAKVFDAVSGSAEEGYSHKVTARDGIPYLTGETAFDGKTKLSGNYFKFTITAPDEFKESGRNLNMVYENSISEAGGYSRANKDDSNAIDVEFKAVQGASYTFTVNWDVDYAETFTVDLASCILEDDMTQAVAPKSLSFNGANSKMAVGESQWLDVKVSKNQIGDIILLGYSSDNEAVVKVSDKGYVTALSKGTASITVYPCHKVWENSAYVVEPIEGAKAATLKITVSDVPAAKISKVIPSDVTAEIDYTKPSAGYRREIYVLEGKQTAAAFENAISEVKNGDYSAFTYTNLKVSETNKYLVDAKKGVYKTTVNSLKPNTDYTVYVRNVSGLRTLEGGYNVATSYAGAVKTFKTTLSKVRGLTTYFDKDLKGQTAVETTSDDNIKVLYDNASYHAKLTDKSATISAKAKYLQGKDYSDSADYIWRTLPLSKDDKKQYAEPKLSYFVIADGAGNSTGAYSPEDAGKLSKNKDYVWYGGEWHELSAIATADKKGKITFKGVGKVYIAVVDTDTGRYYDSTSLYIEASADSVKGKSVKMSVGQEISLSDYLDYKEGKNALTKYAAMGNADLLVDTSDGNFKFEPQYSYSGAVYDYTITALTPGQTLKLNVADNNVTANGGAPTTVTIKTSVVDPVKKLKVVSVDDQQFWFTFEYTKPNASEFRFDLKDAKGKVIDSRIEDIDSVLYSSVYNAKTNTYTCTCMYGYSYVGNDVTILRQSNYTLTVTALYNGYESKSATAKVKTTNIPASYQNLGVYDYADGETINIVAENGNATALSSSPVLKSGNKYTLDIDLSSSTGNEEAKAAKTDSLTWKVGDTKVAKVKANAGTYSAALTAVKEGSTYIEVTSKITKHVIARWPIYVGSVGDGNGYFGEFEYSINPKDVKDKDCLELTLNNSIVASKGQWFVFTAPSRGIYTISGSGILIYKASDMENSINNISDPVPKGYKLYVYATAKTTVSVTGTQYTALSLGENSYDSTKTYYFEAPADNYYTISAVDEKGTVTKLAASSYKKGSAISISNVPVKTKTITVTAAETGNGATVSLNKGESKVYSFDITKTGYYTISTSDANVKVKLDVTRISNTKENPATGTDETKEVKDDSVSRWFEKDTTVYVTVTAPGLEDTDKSATADATATAATTATAKLAIKENSSALTEGTVSVAKGETSYFTYVIPDDGDYRITFTKTATSEANATVTSNVGYADVEFEKEATGVYTVKDAAKNQLATFAVSAPASGNAEVTVTIEKTSIPVIKTGTNTVKLAANVRQAVKFAADADGIYKITVVGSDEGSYKQANNYTLESDRYFSEGSTLTYYLTSTVSENVTVTVTRAAVGELTAGDVAVAKNTVSYLKYTAKAEGLYAFAVKAEGVSVYKASTLKNVASSTAEFSDGEIYMTAGETFYVKIKETAGADTSKATFTISAVSAVSMTAGTATEISLKSGESAWVEFTAKKTARYQFAKQADTGATFKIDRYTSISDKAADTYNYSFSNTFGDVIDAGKKYYYKITRDTASDTEAKKITLTVSEVSASTGTETLKKGEGKWFAFTATENGIYNLSAVAADTAADTTKKPTAEIFDFVLEKLTDGKWYNRYYTYDYYYSSSQTYQLDKDDIIYAYVKLTDDDGAESVSVSLKGEKLTATDAINKEGGIQFANDSKTKTLSYTVTEDGFYTISATEKDADGKDVAANCSGKYYRNMNSYGDSVSGNGYIGTKLEKGDNLTFVITYNGTIPENGQKTVTFAISKMPEISKEAAEVTINSGETKYFVMKENSFARYYVETSDVAEGLILNASYDGDYSYKIGDIGDGYVSFRGYENKYFIVSVTANSFTDTTSKTFKIKGGDVVATDLTTDGATIAKDAAAAGKIVWYKFRAPEAARYAIKVKGADVNYAGSLTDGFSSVNGDLYDHVYEKDETVYIAAKFNTAASDSVAVSVVKAVPAELPASVNVANVEPGEKVWLTFNAPSDGYYSFNAVQGNSAANDIVSLYKYDDVTDSSYEEEVTLDKYQYFVKGETLILCAVYSGTQTNNIELSAKKAEGASVTATESTVSIAANETKYLTYKAGETSGLVKLTYSATSTTSAGEGADSLPSEKVEGAVTLYLMNGKEEVRELNNGDSFLAAANNEYTLKVTSTSAADIKIKAEADTTATVKELAVDDNKIALSTEGEDGAVTYNKYAYAVFTAAESGKYAFNISSTDYAYVYAYKYNIYGGSICSFNSSTDAKNIYIAKGETVYFYIYNYNDSKDVTITVKQTAAASALTVKTDANNVDWTVTYGTDLKLYEFKADKTGYYTIRYNNSSNTVYDDLTANQWHSASWSGSGKTDSDGISYSYKCVKLNIGETYFIESEGSSNTEYRILVKEGEE